jgi:hypothetical protein
MPRSAKLRRAASIESAKFGLRDLKIRKQPRPMRFLDTMVWPKSIVSWGLRPCWGEAKVRCPRRAPVRRWNGIFAAAAKQVDWRNGFAALMHGKKAAGTEILLNAGGQKNIAGLDRNVLAWRVHAASRHFP